MATSPLTPPVRSAPWLEVIEGPAPVLLIAPHGGRAGPAARGTLHPKVNDLYTVEITRELARRLRACAFINTGMDRNRLDCNRMGQLAAEAPWLLTMMAERLERTAASDGRALALIIHGWNVIEPRVDIGLGLKARAGVLRPPGGARVSASDEFINGPLARLAHALRCHGIAPTFGLRYPAGGSQNLLQAFTERFRESPNEALRRLAQLAASGVLDAVQLELSVALRWPGSLRERTLDAISESFSRPHRGVSVGASPIAVVREAAAARAPSPAKRAVAPAPARVGVELYDPAARIGVMASFDLGHGASGARIIVLLGRRRVALFTGEGITELGAGGLVLGPLALRVQDQSLALEFRGPMLATARDGYLNIERALSTGRLHERAELAMSLSVNGASGGASAALGRLCAPYPDGTAPAGYCSASGQLLFDGHVRSLKAIGRIGVSFTATGATGFRSRRMLWAYFPGHTTLSAIEARLLAGSDGVEKRSGRLFADSGVSDCLVEQLELEVPSANRPPVCLGARVATAEHRLSLIGEVESFLPLSRPGPELTRIYTSLGFARFFLDGHQGAGMFEYSRCSQPPAADSQTDEDE